MRKLLGIAVMSVALLGCGAYSFTGASISPDIHSVTINSFPNQAKFVVPSLSQDFTEKLKDKFILETNLTILKSGGDLEFSGVITRYEVKPIAPTGNETAALKRLTIAVQVDFQNRTNETDNWEQSFSYYQDISSSTNLIDVEEQLIETINTQLVDKIFNKALVNW